MLELFLGNVPAALGEAAREQNGIDRSRACAADCIEVKLALLDEPVEHAPGEGAEGAAALQRQGKLPWRPSRAGGDVLVDDFASGLNQVHGTNISPNRDITVRHIVHCNKRSRVMLRVR